MKFCAVLRRYPKDVPGGAEYQSYLICRELAERGHETHYVAHRSDSSDVTEDDGIVVHRLSESASGGVVRTLEEIDPDVCYFRVANDLPLLWRCKRQLDAAFVYNVSRDVQCQPLFAEGPYAQSGSWLRRIASVGRYATYRSLLRVPDEIFAQTRRQQLLLERHRGLESTVVGNGHPVPDLDFEKESPPVVLWLSSLKSVKNPESFVQLAEDCSDLSCRFWMVGRPVDEQLREFVCRRAGELSNLSYRGGCDVEESNEYFRKAAIHVHTGESEGFPNTFIQSWLRKTPIVSLCTDPDSALTDNEIGEHCESRREMEATLRGFIDDSGRRVRAGERARSYGVDHHSIGRVVDRVEQRIQTVVG
jgi:hypothetical protein